MLCCSFGWFSRLAFTSPRQSPGVADCLSKNMHLEELWPEFHQTSCIKFFLQYFLRVLIAFAKVRKPQPCTKDISLSISLSHKDWHLWFTNPSSSLSNFIWLTIWYISAFDVLHFSKYSFINLMFVDHYGSLIRQQINSLGLNISIAWLGSELEHVISRVEGQPFLVLNWEPNTVSRLKHLTRISFPPCRCAFRGLVKILYMYSGILISWTFRGNTNWCKKSGLSDIKVKVTVK